MEDHVSSHFVRIPETGMPPLDAKTQAELEARIAAAGFEEPQTFVLEHGYCRSLYVTDPNGLIIELARDAPDVATINADRLDDAHAELRRWLAGDHRSNNNLSLSAGRSHPRSVSFENRTRAQRGQSCNADTLMRAKGEFCYVPSNRSNR
jgi:hypothetical protein